MKKIFLLFFIFMNTLIFSANFDIELYDVKTEENKEYSIKEYSANVLIKLKDNFPYFDDVYDLATEICQQNSGYDYYSLNFYLPNMDMNSDFYASANGSLPKEESKFSNLTVDLNLEAVYKFEEYQTYLYKDEYGIVRFEDKEKFKYPNLTNVNHFTYEIIDKYTSEFDKNLHADILINFKKDLPAEEDIYYFSRKIYSVIGSSDYQKYFFTFYLPEMSESGKAYAYLAGNENGVFDDIEMYFDNVNSYKQYQKYIAKDKNGKLMLKKELNGNKNFNVEFSADIEIEKYQGVKVNIKSNLPKGTILSVGFYPSHLSENVVIDEKGEGSSLYFDIGNGKYELSILSIAEFVQEDELVRKIFGRHGKNLKGKYIVNDEISGKGLLYEKEVEIKR